MAGNGASSVQASWPSIASVPKAEGADDAPETSPSSDSDGDIGSEPFQLTAEEETGGDFAEAVSLLSFTGRVVIDLLHEVVF
ncbi:unnamed protein product [Victoria cruziana]